MAGFLRVSASPIPRIELTGNFEFDAALVTDFQLGQENRHPFSQVLDLFLRY
jgi:hypothetical protein